MDDCIKDLAQVSDLIWVLEHCANRIPENPDIAQRIFEFGLEKSNCVTEKSVDTFIDNLLNGVASQQENVDQIVHYRITYLKCLDRLRVYLRIYPNIESRPLFSRHFRSFRDSNAVDLALSFALECNYTAVKILMQSFPEVEPYRYDILASFPESVDPRLYEDIFYEASKPMREIDWSENDSMKEFAGISIEDLPIVGDATDIALSDWFNKRARDIESLSGQG
jgi:hypothetical protein